MKEGKIMEMWMGIGWIALKLGICGWKCWIIINYGSNLIEWGEMGNGKWEMSRMKVWEKIQKRQRLSGRISLKQGF